MNSKKKPSSLPTIRSLLTFKIALSIECNKVVVWKLRCKELGSELMLRKESVGIECICEKFDL